MIINKISSGTTVVTLEGQRESSVCCNLTSFQYRLITLSPADQQVIAAYADEFTRDKEDVLKYLLSRSLVIASREIAERGRG